MFRRVLVASVAAVTALTVLVPAQAAPGTPVQDTEFGTDPAGYPALQSVVSLTAGPYGVDVATDAGPVHMTPAGEVAYAPARAGEVFGIALDVSRARAGLGWEPKTLLEDGLRATVDWVGQTIAEPR